MARPPQIMVVDDDPAIRLVLLHVLEDEGFEVRTAADGIEALALCEEQLPDLMLMDLNMPRLDGYGLLAEIRARVDWRFSIIVLTGQRRGRQDVGPLVEVVLIKPFDLDQLMACVTRLLAPRRTTAEVELWP